MVPFGGKCIVVSNVVAMDNLVSVPVTHPCRFLKQQASLAQPTIPPVRTQTINSPEPDPPVRRPAKKSAVKDPPVRRPAKPSVALAQEWLEF